MASVNWQKCTTQTIKSSGYKAHFDNSIRHNEGVVHSNEHIDMSSAENYNIGGSWETMKNHWEERTKEVDKLQPPKLIRKDRVTAVTMEFPCPEEIDKQGKSREFFAKAYKVLQDEFGADNVHGMCVHLDEKHEYYDKTTKSNKTSLGHAHALVSPYTEEKGINGRSFETRASIRSLNSSMDEMCMREFGIGFNTHGIARKQKVEELKKGIDEYADKYDKAQQKFGNMQQKMQKSIDSYKDTINTYKEANKQLDKAYNIKKKRLREEVSVSSLATEFYNKIAEMEMYDKFGNNLGSPIDVACDELGLDYDDGYDDIDLIDE